MAVATRADLFPEGRGTCEVQGPLPVSLGRLASPKGMAGHPQVGEQKSVPLEAGEARRVLLGEVASKSAFLGFLPTEPGYQQVEEIEMVTAGLSSTHPSPHFAGHLINAPISLGHGQAFTAAHLGDGLGTFLLRVTSPQFQVPEMLA